MKDHISMSHASSLVYNEDGNFLLQSLIALYYIFNIFRVPVGLLQKSDQFCPSVHPFVCLRSPLALEITIFCYDTKQLLSDALSALLTRLAIFSPRQSITRSEANVLAVKTGRALQ
jgi:hypothetical protein